MAKRGRPAHPDVLTPREWEVLDLVREGLTNEAIAERLGISVSGVKFHVTEILGKLGLDNRADAARWRPAEARPWWAAVATPVGLWRSLGPGWASGAIAGGLVVVVAGGLAVLVWALAQASDDDGGQVGPVPPNLAGLTVENFSTRVRAAMSPEGTVFHVVTEQYVQSEAAAEEHSLRVEAWIDFEGETAREEFTLDPSAREKGTEFPDRYSSVAVRDTEYSTDGTESTSGPVQSCTGVTLFIAITLPLLCDIALSEEDLANATLDTDAEYAGAPVVALAIESDIVGSDPEGNETRTPSTVTYYADRETLVPVARVAEIEAQGVITRQTYRYESELLDTQALADDFFEPSSIGWVEPTATPVIDPLEGLDGARAAGVTPYWLGEDLVSSDAESVLHFTGSTLGGPSDEGPGYRVAVEYEVISAFREGGVSIWLWEPSEWQRYEDEAVSAMAFLGPCGAREEIEVPGATRAVILAAHEPLGQTAAVTPAPADATVAPAATPTPPPTGCPDPPFDRYAAVVEFPDTVVTINVPHCWPDSCLLRDFDRDPWDSRAGMEAVVRALQVRE